jgi:hypothetical protein
MICFAKPVLTEGLYIVQKEEFSVTRHMCGMYIWWKVKHICNRQTHLLVRVLHKDYDRKGSAEKKNSGHEPQGAWWQDELIGF